MNQILIEVHPTLQAAQVRATVWNNQGKPTSVVSVPNGTGTLAVVDHRQAPPREVFRTQAQAGQPMFIVVVQI